MGTWGTYLKNAWVCVLLALPLSAVHAARPGQGTVVLTGWLQAFDLSMKDVVVEVIVNGSRRNLAVTENGRFTVEIPADTEALLRFEKPGHQPKEIRVNTYYASLEAGTRKLKFAVILDLERHMGGWAYSEPVGSFSFSPEKGNLLVENTRQLTLKEKMMEF